MTFQLTDEQLAIKDFVVNGSGNLVVEAGPGCAKSSTMLETVKHLPRHAWVTFTCFNASVKKELEPRMKSAHPKGRATTFNGIGWSTMRFTFKRKLNRAITFEEMATNDPKYRVQAKELVTQNKDLDHDLRDYGIKLLASLVEKVQVNLTNITDREALLDLIEFYELLPPLRDRDDREEAQKKLALWALKHLPDIMDWGEKQTAQMDFTFTDQMYYLVKWELSPLKPDFLIVDEAQDMSALDMAVIERSMNHKTRVFFVGDRQQTINSFKGAMADSMDTIREKFNCTVLELNRSFRCAPKIVRLANRVKPSLVAAFDDNDGVVDSVGFENMIAEVQAGDAIIARLNAQLVKACLELIVRDKPATILGRNIGTALAGTLDEIVEKAGNFPFAELPDVITEHRNAEVSRMTSKQTDDRAIQMFMDRMDALMTIVEKHTEDDAPRPATSVAQLKGYIFDLFSDDDDVRGDSTVIKLMTAHQSKGLEFDTVWLIGNGIPMDNNSAEEWRVWFVAVTRAAKALHVVGTIAPPWLYEFEDAEAERTDTPAEAPALPDPEPDAETAPKPLKLTGKLDVDLAAERERDLQAAKPIKDPDSKIGTLAADLFRSMTTDQLDTMIALLTEIRNERT